MAKFKVGDKVRVVKLGYDIPKEVNIGDVGTITKVFGEIYSYPIRIQIDRFDGYFEFSEEELEKFKEEDKVARFDVEDKVLVKGGNGDVKIVKKWILTREGMEIYLDGELEPYKSNELELYKEDKMEKTFKEVIRDIKEGEVWESSVYRITRNEKGISIIRKDGFVPDGQMFFHDTNVYKLQRKEYTFEEAFKAYEEGKEIESESYKYKKCNGADCFKLITSIKDEWIKCENGFEIHLDEIRGKWYIND